MWEVFFFFSPYVMIYPNLSSADPRREELIIIHHFILLLSLCPSPFIYFFSLFFKLIQLESKVVFPYYFYTLIYLLGYSFIYYYFCLLHYVWFWTVRSARNSGLLRGGRAYQLKCPPTPSPPPPGKNTGVAHAERGNHGVRNRPVKTKYICCLLFSFLYLLLPF